MGNKQGYQPKNIKDERPIVPPQGGTGEVKKEMVNHPEHYNKGRIEVIDFIEAWDLNFSRGSAIKYICRGGVKNTDREIEDLEKAEWYINREIIRLVNKKKENRK